MGTIVCFCCCHCCRCWMSWAFWTIVAITLIVCVCVYFSKRLKVEKLKNEDRFRDNELKRKKEWEEFLRKLDDKKNKSTESD